MKVVVNSGVEKYHPKTVSITVESPEEEKALVHMVGCWNEQLCCDYPKEACRLALDIMSEFQKNGFSS